MGLWQINADTLASSRFVISPLAETTAALFALEKASAAHPGDQAWLDAHLAAYRALLAADPVTALLVRSARSPSWTADFLTRPPWGAVRFADELERIRSTPAHEVRADIEVSHGGPLPDALRRDDLAQRAADVLAWVWEHAVQPYWPRRRRILEADVVSRTAQLSTSGWAAALDDMRPDMRWLGEGRLQINAHSYPPRTVSGAELVFVPVTPRHGWVAWDAPHRYAVVYPCAGVLSDAGMVAVPDALSRLLGPARAGLLVRLDSPRSTTQLVALTGQGLGSVGGHLRVLHDARLVDRRRAGRSVLYFRTDAGDALVDVQGVA